MGLSVMISGTWYYSVSGAGWVAMIGILLLDRAYGFGIQNFSANLLQAVVIF